MIRRAQEIKKFVKAHYASLAQEKNRSCCTPNSNITSTATPRTQAHAEKLYSDEELEQLPQEVSNFSLGCGNPVAIAELNEGEVVLDLGSGGGLDCFLAASKVGEKGKVIGLDITPEMVQLARKNAREMNVKNVEFRLGEMEHMPILDKSVDVIISNCVINLSPDKDAVFREAYRVLKPGGRLCVSDIVLLGELDPKIKKDLANWASCLAGALPQDEYMDKIRDAGFVKVTADREPVPFSTESEARQNKPDLSSKIASIKVKAFKPDEA